MSSMATYYKGQRIKDLLEDIEQLKQILDDNALTTTPHEDYILAEGYAKLAIAKAKLTALQGEISHAKESKKSRRRR
jgi:hypothetical protein